MLNTNRSDTRERKKCNTQIQIIFLTLKKKREPLQKWGGERGIVDESMPESKLYHTHHNKCDVRCRRQCCVSAHFHCILHNGLLSPNAKEYAVRACVLTLQFGITDTMHIVERREHNILKHFYTFDWKRVERRYFEKTALTCVMFSHWISPRLRYFQENLLLFVWMPISFFSCCQRKSEKTAANIRCCKACSCHNCMYM